MNRLFSRPRLLLLALGAAVPIAGWAADPADPAPAAPSSAPTLTLSDLLKAPQQYANKPVTVIGRYAGMCSDGEDFYFKDHLSTVEVLLPPGGMPHGLKVGTPLRVEGEVLVRKQRGENEVSIKPTSVVVAQPATPQS